MLTSFNNEDIVYDNIGNPTTYRDATCTFNGRQLETYTKGSNSVSYKYDSDGLRTSKTVNGVTYNYYYVNGVLMYEKCGNDYELFYRYDNDGNLALVTRFNLLTGIQEDFSVVTNLQGDVTELLDSNGNVVATYIYDAWGNITSITSTNNIATQNSIRYRGYVYDNETGFYYLQSRYYDSETGRFINCDDGVYIGVNDTFSGFNGFAYCENEPVDCVDPKGLWGYDVHSGYYSNEKKAKTIKYINDYYKYGTYKWAVDVGYPKKAAWMIAESDYLVDKEYSAVTVNNLKQQGWHFNINGKGPDSRDLNSLACILASETAFKEAENYYNKGKTKEAREYLTYAYQFLGMALHPLQDKYAHTAEVTSYRHIVVPNGAGGFNYIYFYEHKAYDMRNPKKKADSAKDHAYVVLVTVKKETTAILKAFFNEYNTLINKCSPLNSYNTVFPKSYKKASKYNG